MINPQDILNCPAFWNSLTPVQKEAVRQVHEANEKNINHHQLLNDDTQMAVWLRVQSMYQVAVVDPSEMIRAETQAAIETYASCPECRTLTLHADSCQFAASKNTPRDMRPEIEWADTNLFAVNYPDNAQVMIDRSVDGELQVRIWNIGDDEPLAVHNTILPSKGLVSDQYSLRVLQKCLGPDYANVHIYGDYDWQNPDDATFIVAGNWTVQKSQNEFVLETAISDYGSRDEPPTVDVAEVARYHSIWQVAERILLEDAGQRIASHLETVADDLESETF